VVWLPARPAKNPLRSKILGGDRATAPRPRSNDRAGMKGKGRNYSGGDEPSENLPIHARRGVGSGKGLQYPSLQSKRCSKRQNIKIKLQYSAKTVDRMAPSRTPREIERYRAFVKRKSCFYRFRPIEKMNGSSALSFNRNPGVNNISVGVKLTRSVKIPGPQSEPLRLPSRGACKFGFYGSGLQQATMITLPRQQYNSCYWKNIKFFGINPRNEPYWRILVGMITLSGANQKDLRSMQRLLYLHRSQQYRAFNCAVIGMIQSFPKQVRKDLFEILVLRKKYKQSLRGKSKRKLGRKTKKT